MTSAPPLSRSGRLMLGVLAAAGLWLVMVQPALAQGMMSVGTFYCSGGTAVGNLYDSGTQCPTTIGFDNIFSFLICNMEQLSSNLMGNMFCGMVTALAPAVVAMLTLAVVIFGAGFTIGVIPATARDMQLFLLKITFVFVFATQSDYLIGYAYKFLISGIRDGVAVALSAIPYNNEDGSASAATGAQVYGYLDKFLAQTIRFASDNVAGKTPSDANFCKNALFSAIAIMAIAFPPIFTMSVLLMVKIAITFMRAVFGYVYALVGITFLLSLAPFFLSFYLFAITRKLFEKWLGYLASFTLQMIILFAFLAFILAINVSNVTSSFTNIIMPVTETKETTAFRWPWEYCTICQFHVEDKDTHATIALDAGGHYSKFISNGQLVCDDPKTPIKAMEAVAPDGKKATDKKILNALITFTFGGLFSLVVLAWIVDGLLGLVGSLAQQLSAGLGAWYAPILAGGGANPYGRAELLMPGSGLMDDFSAGFQSGMSNSSNTVSGAAQGFMEGAKTMVVGAGSNDQERGMNNRIKNWLVDPNQME